MLQSHPLSLTVEPQHQTHVWSATPPWSEPPKVSILQTNHLLDEASSNICTPITTLVTDLGQRSTRSVGHQRGAHFNRRSTLQYGLVNRDQPIKYLPPLTKELVFHKLYQARSGRATTEASCISVEAANTTSRLPSTLQHSRVQITGRLSWASSYSIKFASSYDRNSRV